MALVNEESLNDDIEEQNISYRMTKILTYQEVELTSDFDYIGD